MISFISLLAVLFHPANITISHTDVYLAKQAAASAQAQQRAAAQAHEMHLTHLAHMAHLAHLAAAAHAATQVTAASHAGTWRDCDGDRDADDTGCTASDTDGTGGTGSTTRSYTAPAPSGSSYSGGFSGTLSYTGLEALWRAAGGNPAYAATAACIAEHESGGNQYAHSPTNDFGYFQINASNGSLATYDAIGNARSAIILSYNGTNWSAWTTHWMCGV